MVGVEDDVGDHPVRPLMSDQRLDLAERAVVEVVNHAEQRILEQAFGRCVDTVRSLSCNLIYGKS